MPPDNESPPPLLGSWRAMYVLVLGTLAGLCVLFSLISWVYR
jgi:hypothetical protein